MDELLSRRVGAFSHFFGRVEHQLEAEKTGIARLKSKISVLETDKVRLIKALGLLDRAIAIISANGIGKIESIVTGGLRLVFNDPQMALIVEKTEGKRGNSFRLLVRQGAVKGDPMDTNSGGIVNVIAFLLRVILIRRFKLAQLIILDENFNNVSAEFQPRVSQLLHQMCDKHKFTIFAVTHQPRLIRQADAVYRVSRIENPDGSRQPPTLQKIEGAELEALKQSNEAEIA
jgi:DNA repair exonuclease SbcCD ATPase subunit